MTGNEQLIADAKKAWFSIDEGVIEVDCDWNKTWDITYELSAFAAIRDKRKDAEIAMLREAIIKIEFEYDYTSDEAMTNAVRIGYKLALSTRIAE